MSSVIHTHKKIETEKNSDKDLYKLINNAVYSKTMGNWRNKIDAKLVANKKISWNGHQNQGISHKKCLTMLL